MLSSQHKTKCQYTKIEKGYLNHKFSVKRALDNWYYNEHIF